jgi:hypothetical protein
MSYCASYISQHVRSERVGNLRPPRPSGNILRLGSLGVSYDRNHQRSDGN